MATSASPNLPTRSSTPARRNVSSDNPFRSAYSESVRPRAVRSGRVTPSSPAKVSKCSVNPQAEHPHWWSPSHALAVPSLWRGHLNARVFPVFLVPLRRIRACASTPR